MGKEFIVALTESNKFGQTGHLLNSTGSGPSGLGQGLVHLEDVGLLQVGQREEGAV